MAVKFGQTWWGTQWLQSLSNIDYSNRLPRGATYARKGMVKSLEINGNKIGAKVSGSRRTPYSVSINIPTFSSSDVDRFIDELAKRPILISKLLNRELDQGVLEISDRMNLRVFPKEWTDFAMNCSCPDWAVPCKHLASVIYKVSQEIDNNPFMVFEMHEMDLIEELNQRGFHIEEEQAANVSRFEDLIVSSPNPVLDFDVEKVYTRLDYSVLSNIVAPLVQILPNSQAFYKAGDFKKIYQSRLQKFVQLMGKVTVQDEDRLFDSALAEPLTKRSEYTLHLTANGAAELSNDIGNTHILFQFTDELMQIKTSRLFDYQPSVVGLHHALMASMQLMSHGAIIPQIIQLEEDQYTVRWLPALLDEGVKKLIGQLETLLPPDLLLKENFDGESFFYTSIENQAQELCSLFITQFIRYYSEEADEDDIRNFFFIGTEYTFEKIGEKGTAGAIKSWLDRYYLTSEGFRPVIIVTEATHHDGFEVAVEVEIEDENSSSKNQISLATVLESKTYEKQRIKILQNISQLSSFIPGLIHYVNENGKEPIQYSLDEFAPFLMEVLPAIRMMAIHTVVPRSLQKLIRPKASAKLKTKETDKLGKASIRLDDLLDFDWNIAIGDTQLSKEEFATFLKESQNLVKFKGQYVYMDEKELAKLQKHLASTKGPSAHQLLQMALSEEYDGAPVTLTDDVKKLIKELTTNKPIPLPKGLKATLRPYQERGFSWMYRNSKIGFGSVIADDMGLGKTLQVISLLLKYKEEQLLTDNHKAIVIVPTGLLTNWDAEIQKFAPELSTHIYHGPKRNIKTFDSDVLLTSYGMVRSDSTKLKKLKWQALIIDEAQNIKNSGTDQSKSVKAIKANVRIAMSGTPVENRLSEFWSIMDFTNKGYLGTPKNFKSSYVTPIQIENNTVAVNRFKKVTAPFMMRRMKTDKTIISDLPDKIEQNQYISLTPKQALLYDQTLEEAMKQIEGVDDKESSSQFKRQGLVLQMILALKQICNHPTQYLKNGVVDPNLSGKMETLFQLLDAIDERGEKVLIFTQFKEMGDLLVEFIEQRRKEKPMFYHGGSSVKQRNEMVDRFQHNHADKVFVLSLKAAGTGLNLTAASHVIHFDLWWNPAVENQATDRAYRIGQKSNVLVHRFICKNTFEERIDNMIQEKKKLADMTVATGENWIGKMSNRELKEVFGA